MSKPNNDGGFPLPLIIDPPRICITLEIPDEDAHLRAFWGCLWDLTRWFNWQVDDDKTAKRVADVWLEVYLANHLDWRERLCDMPDDCCNETNDLLKKILKVMEGGFKIVPIENSLPSDFKVDCTPDNFEGNEDDDETEQVQRANALCLTVTRWMIAIMYDWASDMNLVTRLDDVLALAAMDSPPSFTIQLDPVPQFQTVPDFNKILYSDNAFNEAVCLIVGSMREHGNTFSEFKFAIHEARVAAAAADEAVSIAVIMAELYGESRINYTLFSKALEKSFEDIQDGDTFTCECDFAQDCESELELTGNIAGGDIYTVITLTETPNVYHIVQDTHPDPTNDNRYIASVVDTGGRCLHFAQVSGMTQVPVYASQRVGCTGVGDGCDSEDLDGGGAIAFAPTTGVMLGWQSVAPIDTYLEIICCVAE